LSVLIENCTLIKVLEELQTSAGLEFAVAEEAAHRQITARFHSLPLETALKTILNGFNYSFVYGPNDTVQKVTVLRNVPAEVTRETQLKPAKTSVATDPSPSVEEGLESRQHDSRMNQKGPPETGESSFTSDTVMIVTPPNSGGMNIKTISQSMQIDPPQSDDAMKINISPKRPE
jgi:hypothetical protein